MIVPPTPSILMWATNPGAASGGGKVSLLPSIASAISTDSSGAPPSTTWAVPVMDGYGVGAPGNLRRDDGDGNAGVAAYVARLAVIEEMGRHQLVALGRRSQRQGIPQRWATVGLV